jgi:hypothetical protein
MRPIDEYGTSRQKYADFSLRLAPAPEELPVSLAADELLDAAVGFVVGHLHGRMLGEEGGGGMEDAADAAVERELAAADGVDGDAGGVG